MIKQGPFVSSEVEARPSPVNRKRFSTSLEAKGNFSTAAVRLAGLAGALLGWRPGEFWAATPAELAAVFGAVSPPGEAPAGADVLARLQEQYPDG